jgi:hypothetical protein
MSDVPNPAFTFQSLSTSLPTDAVLRGAWFNVASTDLMFLLHGQSGVLRLAEILGRFSSLPPLFASGRRAAFSLFASPRGKVS